MTATQTDLAQLSPTKPLLISLGALVVLSGLAAWFAGPTADPQALVITVMFFAFGLVAQSLYAPIYIMEPSLPHRLAHAVGLGLWVAANLLVLSWAAGAFGSATLMALAGTAVAASILAFVTYKATPNTEELVDRSALARGSPAVDDYRGLLAVVIFAVVVAISVLVFEAMNPLQLAFWAIVATTFLAPTLDFDRPRWQLRLRDAATVVFAIGCAFAMDGVLI